MELLQEALDALHFKQHRFTDKAGFFAFIKGLIKGADPEFPDAIVDKFMHARNTPTLSRAQHLELLRYCVVRGRQPCASLMQRVREVLTSSELFELLQLCFKDRPAWSANSDSDDSCDDDIEDNDTCPWLAEPLLDLPAAQGLTAEQILDVLQLVTQCRGWGTNIPKLLSLPAASGISSEAAQRLLLAAVDAGAWSAVDDLCRRLPACATALAELDAAVLQQQLQAALKSPPEDKGWLGAQSDGNKILALLQHPKLQQYTADILPDVLLAACQLSNTAGFRVKLSDPDLTQLLKLPAASGLSVHVVQRLMQANIQRQHARSCSRDSSVHQHQRLQLLVKLPAAAQLSTQFVLELLQSAVPKGRPSAGAAMAEACTQPGQAGSSARPMRLQQQQHRRRQRRRRPQEAPPADGSQLAQVALQCLQQPCGTAALFPLLRLPWAQQLPAPAVRTLLQAAAERQDKVTFDRLLALPQAPRGGADVQRLAEVMRFSVGGPHVF
jgi:hypothetical protein